MQPVWHLSLSASTQPGHLTFDENWRRSKFPLFKQYRFICTSICGPRLFAVAIKSDHKFFSNPFGFGLWNLTSRSEGEEGSTSVLAAKEEEESLHDLADAVTFVEDKFVEDKGKLFPTLIKWSALRRVAPLPRPVLREALRQYPTLVVSLDGPRALYTAFEHKCSADGIITASEPLYSCFGTFEPTPKPEVCWPASIIEIATPGNIV